jgi:hypothetical protein
MVDRGRGGAVTKLYVGGLGYAVAEITGGVLRKKVLPHHILRSPPAIAFDDAVLTEAGNVGFNFIEVVETTSGTVYTASREMFEAHKVPILRGYGKQSALPLEWWSVNGEIPKGVLREYNLRQAQSQLELI